MSREIDNRERQLSLDLGSDQRDTRKFKTPAVKNVVSFVDAGTQALRRAAIQRVIRAGIFSTERVKAKPEE